MHVPFSYLDLPSLSSSPITAGPYLLFLSKILPFPTNCATYRPFYFSKSKHASPFRLLFVAVTVHHDHRHNPPLCCSTSI